MIKLHNRNSAMKKILILSVLAILLTSCDDMFNPAIENTSGLDVMYNQPTYAQGILANAYILLPYSASPSTDVATDDAVSNDIENNYLLAATGSWTADSNPFSQWQGRKNAIHYINMFLENTDQVAWTNDEVITTMYNDRLKGEAYGLRVVHMYHLLLAHGGWTDGGELLGVPIVTELETATSDFNQPRNTFQECIDLILSDADSAINLLPLDYGDISSEAQIPAKYASLGVSESEYSRVNGDHMRGRITGRIVEAVRAQAALLAASPAYSAGTTTTWEDAANYAAIVLDRINGISGIDTIGHTWYANTEEINFLASGVTSDEIIWRGDIGENLDLEQDNFPPSLYGNGRVNPTQNLVDAFPMANGYPIADPSGNFDSDDPYTDRDPRLSDYIVVNGSVQGPDNSEITTGIHGTNNDAINKESGLSTRTGYYLRKLMRFDCNPNPQFSTGQKHYTARIRYTEIFLAYAEAANEAWGPTGAGGASYSAYDVIEAIRERAGVGASNSDAYLQSVSGNPDLMRELIRNERRLELCFENHRFWDLRRWKVTNLAETARGIQIDSPTGTLVYTPIDVESRDFKDYMYYGPIPYDEVQKWSELEQNAGW